MSGEEARAIAEIAKTTGQVIHAGEGLGGYVARVFRSVPEDLVGRLGGDWLAEQRKRHLATLQENTRKHLEGIARERISDVSPTLFLPLIAAAADEGRPELQAVWSALLANAMLDGSRKIRRTYFDAVGQMDPVDAVVFTIFAECPEFGRTYGSPFT
jgi:hypothetical protein